MDSTIQTYLNGLNDFNRSAKGFRLPTSYEWELAARYKDGSIWTPGNYASGATGPYTDADATTAVTWYWDNSRVSLDPDIYSTHPVGQKPTNGNALGLYDMSGNVMEWCFDKYNDIGRVYRGGGWYFGSPQVGYVEGAIPDFSDVDYVGRCIGFRPVRTR